MIENTNEMYNPKLNPLQKELVREYVRVMYKPEACCLGFHEYELRMDLERELGIITEDEYNEFLKGCHD